MQLEDITLELIKVRPIYASFFFAIADQRIVNPVKSFDHLGWMVHP